MKEHLFIDAEYLAHRAKHVFGDLQHEGSLTGVVYGFLRNILDLMSVFSTDRVSFFWDSRIKLRRTTLPQYKMNRQRELTKEEERYEIAFRRQIHELRTMHLRTIGFANNFIQSGFEADDLIAAAAKKQKEPTIIVSADHDLYQCIDPVVSILNPQTKKRLTFRSFKSDFGIMPSQWAMVKAIAGCSSDNVAGVSGVGEKTAIKYLRGDLKPDCVAVGRIESELQGIVARNLKLVQLPLPGTRTPIINENEFSQEEWNKLTHRLGMKSIRLKSFIRG